MPKRILQVDLGKDARDFVGVSLNDLPILDKSNSTDRKLRKGLGRLAAQPERNGDHVSFFVCDESGGRPHDVLCEPVNERELRTNSDLKSDLELLEQRLPQIENEELRKTLLRHFEEIRKSGPAHQSCSFFKWKTPGGVWRLVWLWGFQRKDLEPAAPIICTDPNCRTLFAKRANDPHCPICSGQGVTKPPAGDEVVKSRGKKKLLAIGGICLALVALAIGYWFGRGKSEVLPPAPAPVAAAPQLVAEPLNWTGPVGARIEFMVRLDSEDVTNRVVARSDSPRVARFHPAETVAMARAPGKSVVNFYLGNQTTQATVTVEPPRNPNRLTLEPAEVTLGVGATSRLRLMGEYDSGGKVDLTEAALWAPADSNAVFVHRGVLEGVTAGTASVRAMYRASASQPWFDASAKVEVRDEEYESLSLALERNELTVRQATGINAEAVAKSGKRYAVSGSSKLNLLVNPPHIARIEDGVLHAIQAGTAKLSANFGGLLAEVDMKVVAGDGGESFEVSPDTIELAVGETTELQVSTASNSPIQFISSAPKVVEVTEDGRVIGRSPGKNAIVLVSQDANQVEINIDVTRELFRSIAIVPERISVAVDETLRVRVVGETDAGNTVDLAPDQIQAERLPASSFVDFDPSTLAIRGVAPTSGSPQTLSLRVGELQATAKISVVAAPMRLVLTPEGSLSVPVGQSAQLQVWANYGDGRRIEVKADRVQWKVTPEPSSGLSFDGVTATAAATAVDAKPLEVVAVYQGESSASVTIQAVAEPPRQLVIVANKNPLVVGETGQFRAALVAADGTSVPADHAEFVSVDAAKLNVARKSGAYTALAAGVVTVAARHPASAAPAKQEFHVVDRDQGELVLRPSSLQLPVGGRADLQLVFVSDEGEREISLSGDSNVKFASLNQDAIDWQPPALIGKRQTRKTFEFAATWQGKTAKTLIDVIEPDKSKGPPELRVVPDQVTLAPGQLFSPKVEQKGSGGAGSWIEVQPTAVNWINAAGDFSWTPSSAGLRPSLALTTTSPDQISLEAGYQGARAKLLISKKAADEVPAASDPDVKLIVGREPSGDTLAVPNKQRYTILIDQDGEQQPAVNVEWLPAFESEHVSWTPPVLSARGGGHVQRLSATVDGRKVDFETRIVGATPPPSDDVPLTDEKPTLVRITSSKGSMVTVPVGAEFTDVKVEAEFASGTPRDVTSQSQLTVIGTTGDAAVAVSTGRITGLRVGAAVVQAEFQGVSSTDGLAVEVVEPAGVHSIEIDPRTLQLAVGETTGLRALGFSGEGDARTALGDVSNAAGLVWESRAEDVVRVAGSTITAVKTGSATVVAKLGTATAATEVTVRDSEVDLEDELTLTPESLVLRVGESKSIGSDIALRRGDIDLTFEAGITSSRPDTVRVDPDTGSLVGVSPGDAQVAFTYGGQKAVLPVTVEATDQPTGPVRVVIEPSSALLGIGESKPVRVFLVDSAGARTDRTASALIESSAPAIVAAQGTNLTGRSTGSATISATLPDSPDPATAQFTVEDSEITDFEVLPQQLVLAPGEEQQLRVQGVGPGGRRDISDHADLLIAAGGSQPQAIELDGRTVRGVSPGEATIDVSLGGKTKKVAVAVGDQSWSDLRIEPLDATLAVGEQQAFLVFAKRGTQERALTPADGVEVRLSNTTAARVQEPFTLVGTSPGFTSLRVQLRDLRAEAKITVTASDRPEPPATPPVLPPGLRFIPDVLTLQLGTPGASVRVVKVAADGTEEDVDHRTEMKFDGAEDVVDKKWTASGAVFKPLKLGSTKVTATFQGLPTRNPLVVRVVDHASEARLEVRPNPVSMTVGETQQFQRVQIIPGRGIAPVDTDYRVVSSDPAVVAVDSNRTLRAVSPGETTVKVTPADVDPKFQDVAATVSVSVAESGEPPSGREDQPTGDDAAGSELVLSGPTTSTVGATAQFTVELLTAEGSKDVTSDGASLVVDRDQANLVELAPGGSVVGKAPSTVSIKARYKDLISAPVNLLIEPVALRFARLEIEVDNKPLAVNESRPYKLWGYPENGGGRQDLTNALTLAGDPAAPRIGLRPSDGIAEHQPPRVIGKAPGEFEMVGLLAQAPNSAQSQKVALVVVDDGVEDLGLLSIQPESISVRVGQPAPPVKILARRPGEREPREVNMSLTSEDPTILKPESGGFVGNEVGQTRLVAEHNGQTVAVKVTVEGNPFSDVAVGQLDLVANGQFSVMIKISGSMSGDTQYRAVLEGGAGTWMSATPNGKQVSVSLPSPILTLGGNDAVYTVFLESRSQVDGTIERFPCTFKVRLDTEAANRK
jgi:uncharacterized protein YjdB